MESNYKSATLRGRAVKLTKVLKPNRIEGSELFMPGNPKASFLVVSRANGEKWIELHVLPTYMLRGVGIVQSPEAVGVRVYEDSQGVIVEVVNGVRNVGILFTTEELLGAPSITRGRIREEMLRNWTDSAFDLNWGKDEPDYCELLFYMITGVRGGFPLPRFRKK